jgi:ribonuclease J
MCGLRDRETIRLGPFSVTPLLVDHSAFEAFALVVEAGGRRLLYSGDLRAHGRKPRTWQLLIDRPPSNIHALLLEGTRLTRTSDGNVTEKDVEDEIAALARSTQGLVLAYYSGQNIDRLVSVYKAARRAGRVLILDLYGAAIAAATGRATIPQADWTTVRVFVPAAQRRAIIETAAFDEIEGIRNSRIFPEELRALAPRAVLTTRGSMTQEIERANCLDGATAVWSMWPGYLEQPGGARVKAWLEQRGIPLRVAHASGHAAVSDLQALAAAISADKVVPIHTEGADRYAHLFERVSVHEDGAWWRV